MTLEELYQIIENRRKNMPKDSYVAFLFREGIDRIIQKVGEETTEIIIAAKNKNKQQLISEMADLWFHCVVLLSSQGIKPEEILSELRKRSKGK